MEIATIQGEARERANRHGNERLRRRGLVPAVIYGHGQAPELVALSLHDTQMALSHSQHVVNLRVAGREQQYLVKDVQYDHLQQTPVHVDLMRFDAAERVKVKVPLEFRGTAKGTAEGGTLVTVLAELEIECPVLEIPEHIRVRVEHLGMNESLKVRDIEPPPGAKLLHSPDDIVVIVHPPRVVEPAAGEAVPAEGAGTEPEVISKGKEETAGEAGE